MTHNTLAVTGSDNPDGDADKIDVHGEWNEWVTAEQVKRFGWTDDNIRGAAHQWAVAIGQNRWILSWEVGMNHDLWVDRSTVAVNEHGHQVDNRLDYGGCLIQPESASLVHATGTGDFSATAAYKASLFGRVRLTWANHKHKHQLLVRWWDKEAADGIAQGIPEYLTGPPTKIKGVNSVLLEMSVLARYGPDDMTDLTTWAQTLNGEFKPGDTGLKDFPITDPFATTLALPS